MEIITQSALETQKLGEKIGCDLDSGKISSKVLCLYGDLGSGKTTFIQGLAKGLGIKKRVISPTFMLIRMYQQEHSAKCKVQRFYHVDLYRINRVEEAKDLGLQEIFEDKEVIVAIEWAEKIKKILPKRRIDICFDYVSENQRKIIFKK